MKMNVDYLFVTINDEKENYYCPNKHFSLFRIIGEIDFQILLLSFLSYLHLKMMILKQHIM
jgi:hypothetical protein